MAAYRKPPIVLHKILLTYILLGAFLVTILAIALTYTVSFISASIVVVLYLIGLAIAIKFNKRKQKILEQSYIFNMGLCLANLNNNPGEVITGSLADKKVKLRMGHLG